MSYPDYVVLLHLTATCSSAVTGQVFASGMAKSQQIPNLDRAAINISQIREQARIDLCDALDSRRGKKALVLDPKLSGPLSLIAEISLLKEHGVENLYYLENEPIETDCRTIIYLVRLHDVFKSHLNQTESLRVTLCYHNIPQKSTMGQVSAL